MPEDQTPKQEKRAWLVYEANTSWAIPKRPKFAIIDTYDEVSRLVDRINFSANIANRNGFRETTLEFSALPLFSGGVSEYEEAENASFLLAKEVEIFHKNRATFPNRL